MMKSIAVLFVASAMLVIAVSARAAVPNPPAQQPPGQQSPAQGGSHWSSGGGTDDTQSGGIASGGTDNSQIPTNAHQSGGVGGNTHYYEHAPGATRVEYHSTLSNVGDSFFGAFLGVFIFIAAHALLFWNEGRTLRRESALSQAAAIVQSVTDCQERMDGALVHSVHRIESKDGELLDDSDTGLVGEFGLPVLKFNRTVKMLQWIEKSNSTTEKQLGGSSRTVTNYTYEKEWRSDLVSSSNYQNPPFPANPATKPLQDLSKTVRRINFGDWTLSAGLMSSIPCREDIQLPAQAVVTAVRRAMGANTPVSVSNSTIYLGDPNYPKIGDVKIEYTVATPQVASVMAQQRSGRTFGPHPLSGNASSGESIELLHTGSHTAAQMIATEQSSNVVMKWVLRVLGFFIMWVGLMMTTGPIEAIANIIPFLGTIVATLTDTLTFLVCIPLSLLTVSIAWIYYRPKVGVMLLIGAMAAFYFVSVSGAGVVARNNRVPVSGKY